MFIEINYKFKKITLKNISIHGFFNCLAKRVSMRILRFSAKILALLRLLVNFFQLRLTKKLKINFRELNIN